MSWRKDVRWRRYCACPIAWKLDAQPKVEYREALFDKLVPYGCGLIMIILAMAAIVGLVTIYKWL